MMALVKRFASVTRALALGGGYVASGALLVMTVGVTLDVLARFLLGAGTKLAIEMSGYAVVAIVFFGLAHTLNTGGHIEIDFLVKRLPAGAQRWYRIFNSLVFLAYTFLLTYFGLKTFWTSYEFNTTSRTGLDVLIWPYQLVIPLGLAITGLLLVSNIVADILGISRKSNDGSAGGILHD